MDKLPSSHIQTHKILVTGATGFIGSRLVKELSKKGYGVRAMSRTPRTSDDDNVVYVKADAFNSKELEKSLVGVDVAYYLLHSMEPASGKMKKFEKREEQQARNFLLAAEKNHVQRIIYLGGLVSGDTKMSVHMESRNRVGQILSSGSISVTELRAPLIIGAGGSSYSMLRYLVERLRIVVCPKWVKSLTQPIAVDDVIKYLIGCYENRKTAGKVYDIGGPDVLDYEELMKIYAKEELGRNLFVIHLPFLTTKLSSYWVDLITPVKASIARPLIDSLVHDTLVKDDSITKDIPIKLKSVKEAIRTATKELKDDPPEIDVEQERTGFKINQRVLMVSLMALGVLGTTYYWLDGRQEVYQPSWLAASAMWYFFMVFGVVFVKNKTRLGYLVAGILSWVTLAFWILDNYFVVFEVPVIAAVPENSIVVRNYVGVLVAAVSIAASHNLFHKVAGYQSKGRPI